MSWDAAIAHLDWNYTHNTNPMIAKVLDTAGVACGEHWLVGRTWYHNLNGLTGAESLPLLDRIVGGLCEAPSLFREMNPPNGWGCYEDLLRVLMEMRAAAAAWPDDKWEATG